MAGVESWPRQPRGNVRAKGMNICCRPTRIFFCPSGCWDRRGFWRKFEIASGLGLCLQDVFGVGGSVPYACCEFLDGRMVFRPEALWFHL